MRRRLFHSTSIARFVLIFALAQCASLGLGLYLMFGLTSQTILGDARRAAELARDNIARDFRDAGPARATARIAEEMQATENHDFVVFLRGPDGTRVVGNLGAWPTTVSDREHWRTISLYREESRAPEQMGVVTTRLKGGYTLLTGQVLEGQLALVQASETAMFYAMAMSLALAAGIAFFFSRFLENHIDRFSGVARAVDSGNLSARVERNGTGDSFDRLGLTINRMLQRIERLVQELRMVTDSMAHDLRSPVSRLKSTLERGLGRTRDPAALAVLGEAIEEADGLHRMLNTALQISRAEAGIGRDQFTRFDLAQALDNLVEVYGPVAEDAGFVLGSDGDARLPVVAHRDLLNQALSNLIDNALKYAKGGQHIMLHAEIAGDEVEITVRDDGPGIPAERTEEALRRFGRLDAARTESGSGLGLSLVSTIAQLHGGVLTLGAADPQGLVVTLRLPILPDR
ncbi:HAMP domain-containing sensor histidine kinase [Novosphingobium sp.]|uniref:sensor histidine kinase n=1 Tax=Novosphingobium sp. TaxID=1874826 RepID=UPI001D8ADA7B|nr:HAMP domain-containing sensor histidine kinase [Novosphingobium sp.]MBX9663879.1 HAMP domain-containing histidine kinase [Novosphingobium sp.]